MATEIEREVDRLLHAWNDGEPETLTRLTPLIYEELHRQAKRFFERERAGHTLQTTALVHEVYLRLAGERRVTWQSRAHFFGAVARLMRRVLVEHARSRGALKRGGELRRVRLAENLASAATTDVDVLALDQALARLARLDPRQVRIIEMRFFAGLTVEETAEVMGLGRATILREWRTGKAWLAQELGLPDSSTHLPDGGPAKV